MKALIIAAALAASTAAQAGFMTGNRLYQHLNDGANNYVNSSVALGFIVGVHDTLDGILHCSPPGVTQGQVRDLVQQHLRDNPATRELPAHILASDAMTKAWPCPKKPTSGAGNI